MIAEVGSRIALRAAASGGSAARAYGQIVAQYYGQNNNLLNSPWLTGLYASGLLGGLVSFWKGLGDYREYRMVEDIPRIPARSVAMGTVQVSGTARGEAKLISPVTRTPCLFCHVVVERATTSAQSSAWQKTRWKREKVVDSGSPFYLDDGTGRVAVDLRGADFEMEPNGDCEMDPVAAYAAAEGSLDMVTSEDIGAEGPLGERCRLTEFLILPDREYDVVGNCVRNPDAQGETDRNLVRKGGDTFMVSDRTGLNLKINLQHKAAAEVFGGSFMAVGCLVLLLGQFRLI